MRTKTLLVAAAALAVSVATSMAQTTYSQNVVGYVNVNVPAGKYWFLANQLQNGSDANQTNNNAANIAANGLISDPNGVLNTVLYVWNGGGYSISSYFTAADWVSFWGNDTATNGFYNTGTGNYFPSLALNQGVGSYLYNPPGNPTVTLTLTGTVPQGTNAVTIVQGYNALSVIPPVSTNIDSTLLGFAGVSDPNGVNNDQVYVPQAVGGYVIGSYFTAADWVSFWGNDTATNGFYNTGTGDYLDNNPAFIPQVGQAFFVNHVVASPETWNYTFTVQ